ncbi:hypothetical protein [Geodermatophilus sp. SYSU D01105]
MPTEVAFSSIQTVTAPTDLGAVSTDRYARIRVLADCRFDSDATVEIRLVLHEGGGAPGDLDRFLLDPGESVQRTYDVPGTGLGIRASPVQSGPSTIDVWIWGYRAPGD